MTRLLLLLVVACGPRSTPSNPPTNPNIDRGKDIERDPDQSVSGTSVHLTCTAVSPGKCTTPSYTFAADYTQPTNCRWGADKTLAFSMNAANSSNGLLVAIENFNGAGTYDLTGNSYVRLGATVTMAATSCSPEHTGAEVARSPVASCSGCKATVLDPDPAAAFPKPLTMHIVCPKLCSEDAYVCGGPINLTLTQPCSQ